MLLTVLMLFTNTATVLADDGEQATAEPDSFYTVRYEFVLSESDEALPEEVKAKLPDNIANLKTGDQVENFPVDEVVLDDVTYSFLGWSQDWVTIADSDVTVTGTWEKKATVKEEQPIEEPKEEEPVKDEGYPVEVVFVEFGCVITILFNGRCGFLVVHITDTFEEEERENVLLIGTGINVGSEQNCRVPKVGLQLFDGYSLTH